MLVLISLITYIEWIWGKPHMLWDIPLSFLQIVAAFIFIRLPSASNRKLQQIGYAAIGLFLFLLALNTWFNLFTLIRVSASTFLRSYDLYHYTFLLKALVTVVTIYTLLTFVYLTLRSDRVLWLMTVDQALVALGFCSLTTYVVIRLAYFFIFPQLSFIFSWVTFKITFEALGTIALLLGGYKMLLRSRL